MLISERIYKYLAERGMSQIEFSKRTGISQSTISDWRRKATNPSSDKILCRLEGYDEDWTDVSATKAMHWTNVPAGEYQLCLSNGEFSGN